MSDNIKKIDKYQFNMKDTLGKGSFGKVFKGQNQLSQQLVAVKMINKELIKGDKYLEDGLMQEINVMKKLKSVNVVQLIDVLETTNNYYIIQEYCDGGDFRHYLEKRKRLDEQQSLKVLQDLLTGFIELLKNGIIHRDLKPENILLHQTTFKLADFGFARTVGNFRREMLQSLVGTPLYMSPQILTHERYTSKSDIWSLGLIYYEMICGQTPWDARSQYELVQNIKTKPLQFPSDIKISEDCKDFIRQCLQIDENQRISWDNLYKHNYFKGYFKSYVDEAINLENKALTIINNMRQKIHSTKTDLLQLFKHFDLSKDSKLEINEFEKLLKSIDNCLTREEIEFVFNKFDEDGNNEIDFQEFTKFLQENQIRLSVQQMENPQNKKLVQQQSLQVEDNQQPQNQSPQNNNKVNNYNSKQFERKLSQNTLIKANQAIMKLQHAIQKFNINLNKLFSKFDQSADHELSLQEFGKLICRIENLNEEEIKMAFEIFDKDGSGSITYNEFYETIQYYANNIPQIHPNNKAQGEEADQQQQNQQNFPYQQQQFIPPQQQQNYYQTIPPNQQPQLNQNTVNQSYNQGQFMPQQYPNQNFGNIYPNNQFQPNQMNYQQMPNYGSQHQIPQMNPAQQFQQNFTQPMNQQNFNAPYQGSVIPMNISNRSSQQFNQGFLDMNRK